MASLSTRAPSATATTSGSGSNDPLIPHMAWLLVQVQSAHARGVLTDSQRDQLKMIIFGKPPLGPLRHLIQRGDPNLLLRGLIQLMTSANANRASLSSSSAAAPSSSSSSSARREPVLADYDEEDIEEEEEDDEDDDNEPGLSSYASSTNRTTNARGNDDDDDEDDEDSGVSDYDSVTGSEAGGVTTRDIGIGGDDDNDDDNDNEDDLDDDGEGDDDTSADGRDLQEMLRSLGIDINDTSLGGAGRSSASASGTTTSRTRYV